MKRKVLSVMLCAAMVVSMTACGGSDAKESRMHRRKNRSPVH